MNNMKINQSKSNIIKLFGIGIKNRTIRSQSLREKNKQHHINTFDFK